MSINGEIKDIVDIAEQNGWDVDDIDARGRITLRAKQADLIVRLEVDPPYAFKAVLRQLTKAQP